VRQRLVATLYLFMDEYGDPESGWETQCRSSGQSSKWLLITQDSAAEQAVVPRLEKALPSDPFKLLRFHELLI
jgi:hypothetical protein